MTWTRRPWFRSVVIVLLAALLVANIAARDWPWAAGAGVLLALNVFGLIAQRRTTSASASGRRAGG